MTGPAIAAVRPAYRDGNVLRWLAAYTASVTGDVVYFLALSWSATRTAGPSQAGLVVATGALPRAVFMLVGGVVADRFGPRRVAAASDATRCLVILATAAALVWAAPGIWLLVPLALLFGTVDAVFMPAVGAFPPRITTREQLVRVQGMRGLSIRLSNSVGPAAGGVALATGGAAGAFAAAGVLFAVSLVLLLTVRVAPTSAEAAPKHTAPWRELVDGLRYVRRHRMLAPLTVVIGLSEMCFSGPVALGLVLLADERGWGAAGTGWMASAFSVGAAVAALWITVLPRIPHAGLGVIAALLATAAATTALGHAPSLLTATALAVLIGLASGATVTLTSALVQAEANPQYLGRVTSLTTLCTLGLAPALFPVAGVTAQIWGAAVFFTGCGVISLLAAALAVAVPPLRHARLQGTDA
ncbi:MFS transporter [Streptomyces antnestii]|uniref:MFS transporter n=1 Tax=Streptomyces antnestii TaxID=2494256 RepID=A0A437Q3A9_9ACTN|nr:MFS transporter [Streptomyces sp. San01]RVU29004.1 MFS transporter [Streptomyces sp. San01]